MADPYFEAATVGLGFVEGISGAHASRSEARANLESVDAQIELLNKQREELGKAYETKKELVRDRFGNKISSLETEVSFRAGNIREKSDRLTAGTGLSYSGTVEYGKTREEDILSSRYGTQRESLFDSLGQSLFDIDMERTETFARMDSDLIGLRAERKIQDERASESAFGLGIF